MAVKASRISTLILLLTLSFVTVAAPVWVSPAFANCGNGGSTSGDPDTPWDKSPLTSTNPSAANGQAPQYEGDTPVVPRAPRQLATWMVVQQLLSAIVGRPGLLR